MNHPSKLKRAAARVAAPLAFTCMIAAGWALAPAQEGPPRPPTTTPATGAAAAEDPNRVILKVGEDEMTVGEFRQLVPEQAAAPVGSPQEQMMRAQLLQQIVPIKMMSIEAQRRGVEEDPAFQQRVELLREQLMANWLTTEIRDNITDEQLRQHYEQNQQDYEQVTARHILIPTTDSPLAQQPGVTALADEQALAKAQELRARITGGEDFAAIARAESADRGSAATGGNLGTFGRGRMVPQFEQAAFTLEPGTVSEPVRSQFGYHLIEVQERTTPPFEEVKEDIREELAPAELQRTMANLEQELEIDIDEEFFGVQRGGAGTMPGLPGLPPGQGNGPPPAP